MKQKAVYAEIYRDKGFERKGLFELISKEYPGGNVLYPGCSMHITPSFVFQHVVYVDQSKEAKEFFANDQAVRELITDSKIYKTASYYRFLSGDYTIWPLALEDCSFDILISLYAGNVIRYCKRYVRYGGIIVSNNFHDEALDALKQEDLRLIGYIRKAKNKYTLYKDDPNAVLKHRDEAKVQKLCIKNRNGSMWYEDHET